MQYWCIKKPRNVQSYERRVRTENYRMRRSVFVKILPVENYISQPQIAPDQQSYQTSLHEDIQQEVLSLLSADTVLTQFICHVY